MGNQINEEITVQDIGRIFYGNLSLGGKKLSEWQQDFVGCCENLTLLRDNPPTTSSILENLIGTKKPKYYDLRLDLPNNFEEFNIIFAILTPSTELRKVFGLHEEPEYRYGYEWPILLLKEAVDQKIAIKFERILGEIISNQNISVYGKLQRRMAFAHLVNMYILYDEIFSATYGYQSTIKLGALDSCGLSDSKLRKISLLSDDDRILIEIKRNSPVFELSSILDSWDKNLKEISSYFESGPKVITGVYNFMVFPPLFMDLEMIKDFLGYQEKPLSIEVSTDLAQIGERAIAAGIKVDSSLDDVLVSHLNLKMAQLPTTEISDHKNVFYQLGDMWLIYYNEIIDLCRNIDGFRYINILLSYPGSEFHVFDLIALVKGDPFSKLGHHFSTLPDEILQEMGLSRGRLENPAVLAESV